jgi:hypothetical protein
MSSDEHDCSVYDLDHDSEIVCSRSSVDRKLRAKERSHTLTSLSFQSAARSGV